MFLSFVLKQNKPPHLSSELNQFKWIFFGSTDTEAPVLWPPHAKRWLIGKDSDAGRDWGQEEKGTTEDEMAGWQHRLDGHESEWTRGVGDGWGGLACCDSWGRKESDTTERLNWTDEDKSCSLPEGSQEVDSKNKGRGLTKIRKQAQGEFWTYLLLFMLYSQP